MASRVLADFPKVNLVSILAGTLALISVFLPWWGITGQAFGFSASVSWSLWGRPYLGYTSASPAVAQANQTMGLFDVLVLGLVFITVAIAFLGSFDANKAYLVAGFATAITTIFVYAGAVSYTIASFCQGQASCISGPVGSTVFPSGDIASWGFQSGFYLFLVGAILTLFAVIFHHYFFQRRQVNVQSLHAGDIKFCSNCGRPLQADAKFCSHCAHAVPIPASV